MVKARFSLLLSKYGMSPFSDKKGILNHEPTAYKPMIFWSGSDEVVSTTPVTGIFFDQTDKEYIVKTSDGIYSVRLGE